MEFVGFNIEDKYYYIERHFLINLEDCFLRSLIFGLIPSQKDEEGRIILHIKTEVFHWIIHYLQRKSLPKNLSIEEYNLISIVADYLNLTNLLNYINETTQKPKLIWSEGYKKDIILLTFIYRQKQAKITVEETNTHLIVEGYGNECKIKLDIKHVTTELVKQSTLKVATKILCPELLEEITFDLNDE